MDEPSPTAGRCKDGGDKSMCIPVRDGRTERLASALRGPITPIRERAVPCAGNMIVKVTENYDCHMIREKAVS